MELAYYVIIWLYIFGFIGIFLTQAADYQYKLSSMPFDTVSIVAMVFWPVTVPLAGVLIAFDHVVQKFGGMDS